MQQTTSATIGTAVIVGCRDEFFEPIKDLDAFTLWPTLLRPRSRGFIRLRSTDPFDRPIIQPNYLSDPHDVNVMIEGVKIGLALAETEAFRKLGAKFYSRPFPGCTHLKVSARSIENDAFFCS